MPSVGPAVKTLSAQVHADDGAVIVQMQIQPHIGTLQRHGGPVAAFAAKTVHDRVLDQLGRIHGMADRGMRQGAVHGNRVSGG